MRPPAAVRSGERSATLPACRESPQAWLTRLFRRPVATRSISRCGYRGACRGCPACRLWPDDDRRCERHAVRVIDGGGLLAGIEGAILTALAVGGLLRPATAARLLRPPGRVVIPAALFALAGAFDWGIQSHFSEVAPAIVWIAVIVSSPAGSWPAFWSPPRAISWICC